MQGADSFSSQMLDDLKTNEVAQSVADAKYTNDESFDLLASKIAQRSQQLSQKSRSVKEDCDAIASLELDQDAGAAEVPVAIHYATQSFKKPDENMTSENPIIVIPAEAAGNDNELFSEGGSSLSGLDSIKPMSFIDL